MPRKMSPEREREFEELHAFVCFYTTHIKQIDPSDEIHPANVGKRIVDSMGRSRALEGWRQASNDILEETQDLSPPVLTELDRIFRSRGILTISELRYRQSASFRRILKRGSIRNETEYYLINGIVVDMANGIPEEERDALQRLMDAFENTVSPPST